MAASAAVQRQPKGPSAFTKALYTAVVLYNGAFIAQRGPAHVTAAARGYLAPFAAAAGNVWMGVGMANFTPSVGSAESVTGLLTASPPPTASAKLEGQIFEKQAVTGLSADNLTPAWVYAGDDNTLTLVRPAIGQIVGFAYRYRSSGVGDVYLFSVETVLAINANGNGKRLVNLGSYAFANAANGNLRTAIPLMGHGKIVDVFAMVSEAMVGSGGTVEVNLEIDTVNVTGGVVTVSTAAGGTLGTKLAGTAITAENVFHEGSVLDVEAANAGGTQTSGRFDLYIVVEDQIGL